MGHQVCGLVVVGDHDVDAAGEKVFDLVSCGDAVVDSDDKRRVAAGDHAVQGLGRQAVALAKTVRDIGLDARAQATKAQGKQAGRAHAVHVKVTKDGDLLAAFDGLLDAIGHLGHAGDVQGVCPVAVKRRREERAGVLDRLDTARRQHASDQRIETQLVYQVFLGCGVGGQKRPAGAVRQARHG